MMRVAPLTAVIVTLASATASAQPPPRQAPTRQAPRPAQSAPFERVFVSVNGMFQSGSNDFQDTSTLRANAEDGSLTTSYTVGSGPAFDIAGGFLLLRNLGVGVGLTRFSTSTVTTVNASVPHPFFFNQGRSVTGEVNGSREEMAIHVQVRGVFPVNRRVTVTVFGGPSFFQVDQGIVNDITYTEAYPFDAAPFSSALQSTQSESGTGVNVGGDVAFFFGPNVGVGVGVQYSSATVQMTLPSGASDVKAGGAQVGGGLRLRF
jgi:opacity protein-like surface antigen